MFLMNMSGTTSWLSTALAADAFDTSIIGNLPENVKLNSVLNQSQKMISNYPMPLAKDRLNKLLRAINNNNFNSLNDLSSKNKSIKINNLTVSAYITQANHKVKIDNYQFVTPAQELALKQISDNKQQTIILDVNGIAIGGSFDLKYLNNNIDSLIIPLGVTAIINDNEEFQLTGSIINNGKILVDKNIDKACISANNIFNADSGLIIANNSLSLNIGKTFINTGIISITNNNLTINAGLSLINTGNISAWQNLNLNVSTGLIVNDGKIIAKMGDLNINEPVVAKASDIVNITSCNGLISAESGNINLKTNTDSKNTGININGGNMLALTVNLKAPEAIVNITADNITGILNVNAQAQHIVTTSKTLSLGNISINGDPSFVNTAGDINLTGAISATQNLAILASGNINITSPAAVSITVQDTTNGYNLLMIAGLGSNLTSTGTNSPSLPNGTPLASGQTITAVLGSSTGNSGGNIDLSTNNTLASGSVINAQAPGSQGNGGNVTLVAITNNATNPVSLIGGQVLLPINIASINASGNGSGNNGNINIIANANSGIGIQTASIINDLGGGASGNVSLYAAPTAASTVVIDYTGSITSGTIAANTSNLANSTITLNGSINCGTGIINILSGSGQINSSSINNVFSSNIINLTSLNNTIGINQALNLNCSNLAITAQSANLTNSSSLLNLSQANIEPLGILQLIMTNPTSGSIIMNAAIDNSGGNIKLTTSGSGTITATSATNTLSANNLILNSSNGDIGSSTLNLPISSKTVYINSQSNAYIDDSFLGTVDLSNNNIAIANPGTLSFNMTNVLAGSLSINSNLSTGSNVDTSVINLAAANLGSINVANNNTIVTAGNINLTSNSGFMGSPVQYLLLNTNNLRVSNSAGNDYLSSSINSLNLNNSNLTDTGSLFLDMTNLSSGSVVVNGNVTAGTVNTPSLVSIAAAGSGTITNSNPNNLITAGVVDLACVTGNIGSSSIPIALDTSVLFANNLASAYISDSYNGTLNISNSDIAIGSNGVLNLAMTNATAGSILVNGTLAVGTDSGTGVIDLTASGSGTLTQSSTSNLLTAGTVNLNSGSGNIGSTTQNILVDSGNLSVNSLANAYLSDSSSNINLNASSVGSSNSLDLSMSNSTSGSILVNGLVSAGANSGSGVINLTASGSGIITQANTGDILTAGTVNLISGSGNIGSSSHSFLVDTSNLSVNSLANAYLSDSSGSVNLNATSVGSSDSLNLIMSNASSGSINVNGLVSAGANSGSGVINLTASGSGIITQANTSDIITAGTINLISGSGNIGSLSKYISVDSANLSVNNNASAYVGSSDDNGIILQTSNTATDLFIASNATINVNGALNSANIELATGGSVNVNANIGNTSAIVGLTIYTSGNISTNSASIIAGQLTVDNGIIGSSSSPLATQASNMSLNAVTSAYINNTSASLNMEASSLSNILELNTSGNLIGSGLITCPVIGLYASGASGIGTSSSPVQINATTFAASGFASGANVYVNNQNTNGVNLENSQAGNTIDITTASGIYIPGYVNGSVVTLATTANNGSIQLANNIGNTNASVFLTATGAGDITQSSTSVVIYGANVSLTSGSGNISVNPLNVYAPNVSLSTSGSGSAYIYGLYPSLNINGAVTGGNMTIFSSGSLTIADNIATGNGSGSPGGNINLTCSSGVLNIGSAGAVSVEANYGSVLIINNDTSAGSIYVAANSYILGNASSLRSI